MFSFNMHENEEPVFSNSGLKGLSEKPHFCLVLRFQITEGGR